MEAKVWHLAQKSDCDCAYVATATISSETSPLKSAKKPFLSYCVHKTFSISDLFNLSKAVRA